MRIPILILCVFLTNSLFAQAPETLPAPACNADFAILLVQQQVMEGRSVTDPVKRIKILNRSADFLWPFDEPTARSYFAESWKMADDRFKEKGFESKTSGSSDSKLIQLLPDQRMEVIRAIMKRDKEWAQKLSDQMLADFEKTHKDRKDGFDRERELMDLMNFAVQNVETNPEVARAIMRKLMRYQLHSGWFTGFYGLAKNKPLADSIYLEALTAFRNESPRRLLFLSPYPFARTQMFGIDRNSMMISPPDFAANDLLGRRWLEVFFARIAAFAASEEDMNRPAEQHYLPEPAYMVTALDQIEPYIMERFPDMLGRFGEARAQAASLLSEDARKNIERREKNSSGFGGTFEERLKQIEEAESEGKLTDSMIVFLVVRDHKTDEHFEQIEPWLAKVKEEKPRADLVNFFWFKRAKLAVDQKRFDDAEKHAQKVPELQFRAILLFDMARIQEKSETDAPALFETLNRVSKLARNAENSVAKAQILLGLSNMYEKVNHSTAMDELSEAIRVTNILKEPDLFQTNVIRQIVGKGYGHFTSYLTPGYDLEKTFEQLSKKNFEISLGHAKSIDDRYLRTLAVIAVASNCAKNSKPAARPKPAPKAQ